ncbi:hypothetical protein [Archangium primigenium]|uniref:hypothetical protein n=1 Tax=[Archangium] primigenium TaxID=2792470 RepID=UPI00195B60D8|nr:hypothetical protein [Archangium primigenium]MBM7112547.1 hypothetical protein [Archangium primigenium]
MRRNQWRAVVLAPVVGLLSACGGTVEEEVAPTLSQVRMSDAAEDVEALAGGPSRGCPTQKGECKAYCKKKGHTSGKCTGYGRGVCSCGDAAFEADDGD